MSADERGAYVILEGREALGLSFAEACDDLTFIEKASRYRGRSPHLASLRDYARCRMELPLVESRGLGPRTRRWRASLGLWSAARSCWPRLRFRVRYGCD